MCICQTYLRGRNGVAMKEETWFPLQWLVHKHALNVYKRLGGKREALESSCYLKERLGFFWVEGWIYHDFRIRQWQVKQKKKKKPSFPFFFKTPICTFILGFMPLQWQLAESAMYRPSDIWISSVVLGFQVWISFKVFNKTQSNMANTTQLNTTQLKGERVTPKSEL